MSAMIKRKSRAFRRKVGGAKGPAAGQGKSKPLRFSSPAVGSKGGKVVANRTDEAPDAYLGAVDGSAGFSPALLRQALMLFYAKHGPDKDYVDELLDILVFYAAKSGLAALNMKLRNKYGVDLDAVEIPAYYSDTDEDDEPPPPGDWGDSDMPPPPMMLTQDGDDSPPPPPEDVVAESIPDDVLAGLEMAFQPPPPPPEGEVETKTDKKERKPRKSFFARRKSRKPKK